MLAADGETIHITLHQWHIAHLMAYEGLNAQQIADRLDLSLSRVKNVFSHLFLAFAVQGTHHLVVWLWRSGQLQVEEGDTSWE